MKKNEKNLNMGSSFRKILQDRLDLRDENEAVEQEQRFQELTERFLSLFGKEPVRFFSAPGRTEICGNHTDHEGGKVLAAAVDLDTIAAVRPRPDLLVRFESKGYPGMRTVDLSALGRISGEAGTPESLIRGVAAFLSGGGDRICGFDACFESRIPIGAGLSSSAAFEVLNAEIFNSLCNREQVTPIRLALAGQYAENTYFEKPSGLMDQLASSLGGAVLMDFRDPMSPETRKIGFDLRSNGLSLCITDTGGSHENLTDEYASIPEEMHRAAAVFGKSVLREVPEEQFVQEIQKVRSKAGDRAVLRALHYYSEYRRVGEICSALEKGRTERFLELIRECGDSSFEYNQNAYSIRTPRQQGIPLALALSDRFLRGRGGAWRLQGGGFAGTIQAYLPDSCGEEYRFRMEQIFGRGCCRILNIREAGAVCIQNA